MKTAPQNLITLPSNCPWGIAVWDHASGDLIEANDYMTKVYECSERSSINRTFTLATQNDLLKTLQAIEPGQEWSGRIFPRANRQGISSVEILAQRSRETPEHIWFYTLEHPKVNEALRFSSRSELQMLRVLLENTLEYVFFRDVKGHFILTNKAFRSTVSFEGQSPSVDNKIEDFVAEKSAAWISELDEKLKESGSPIINEVSLFVFKNGTKHWLQMTTVPVRNDEGELIGSLSVARDISDLKITESELRKAIAEAHAASRAKGEFLAAMSHEIRTPINGIIGASELCQETPLDIEQRGYLETVIQCGSTLLGLVNDVLDFSKIEAGQLNLESLNFSPRNLIESVAEEFAQTARLKKLELVASYDEALPEYLMGDPVRVKQIFYNLVGNAVKFTQTGEVVIKANTLSSDATSAVVEFSVSDTGIGISEERQQAIFESFTQADMSTTRKFGGSGLGLTISKELVRLMKGQITVSSEQNKGSSFTFTIPFQRTQHHGAEAVPYNSELAGMRVLIVDDNDTNRDLYRQMCAGWGYRSELVSEGIGALSKMEEATRENDPFQLLLLDQQMPGLTGLDFASLVKSRPDLRNAHIVLLSSSLNRTESDRADEIGIDRALSKPVKRAVLLEVILETFGVSGETTTPPTSEANTTSSPPSDTPMRILLVEDNPVNQQLAIRRLEKLGHSVVLVDNGYDAVESVHTEDYDCVLMDIQMPGMDGHQATQAIRTFEAESGRTPIHIIAMTAHALKGDRERCLEIGMNDYVSKPFRAEDLKTALNTAAQSQAKEKAHTQKEEQSEQFSKRLAAMDPDDREDVLATAPLFLKSFPKEVLKLQKACAEQDFKKCYFLAHTLKGIAGIFGSDECVALAERLETASEKESPKALQSNAEALIEAMRQLAKEVEFAAM